MAEEEKVTMNLLEQKPPQDIVSERTILERPRFVLEVVKRERASKIYYCRFCMKEFSCRRALGGHQNAHKKERELHKKLNYGEMSSGPFMYGGGGSSSSRPYLSSTGPGAKRMKTTMFPPHHHSILNWSNTAGRHRSSTRYPLTPKKYTSNAFSNDEDINLDLTLGPSNPIGGIIITSII
ncbi:PREDICTED: zinc finger protein 1-like [Camelina sativa]|uniref:Zinc finger protein 1-like n=1 Tax=Camelina sativa TaxID=90675 RepID=A0ABM0UTI2_CAMSA|nr:PREDICTED: zinc finger protein 1-like [Camelina sativa]